MESVIGVRYIDRNRTDRHNMNTLSTVLSNKSILSNFYDRIDSRYRPSAPSFHSYCPAHSATPAPHDRRRPRTDRGDTRGLSRNATDRSRAAWSTWVAFNDDGAATAAGTPAVRHHGHGRSHTAITAIDAPSARTRGPTSCTNTADRGPHRHNVMSYTPTARPPRNHPIHASITAKRSGRRRPEDALHTGSAARTTLISTTGITPEDAHEISGLPALRPSYDRDGTAITVVRGASENRSENGRPR